MIFLVSDDLATSGSNCLAKTSNGAVSRNHRVSFVVRASMTESISFWSPAASG